MPCLASLLREINWGRDGNLHAATNISIVGLLAPYSLHIASANEATKRSSTSEYRNKKEITFRLYAFTLCKQYKAPAYSAQPTPLKTHGTP